MTPEQHPRAACDLVVIGGSAGALPPLREIVARLPAGFAAPVVVVQHSVPTRRTLLSPILARHSSLAVRDVTDGDELRAGTLYVVPSDRHAHVTADGRLRLSDGTLIQHLHSSANPLFESAAAVFGDRVIAVVLSGSGMDATDGVQAVRRSGGTVIVQSQESATHFGMPGSAIASGSVDYVLGVHAIAAMLTKLVGTADRPRA